jgi:RNA polymerase sporulation-specific sigma factor
LLRRAQRGDQYAERLLIDLHEPLARRVSRGFFVANGDEGDLLQAALVGLWQAIHAWDPRRGTFRAFAGAVMRRKVMMLVTASRSRNQSLLNTACPLHGDSGREMRGRSLAESLVARDAAGPVEQVLERERLALILQALAALSEHERRSLRMTINGLSQATIGAALDRDAKSVNNALQRARRKLNAALEQPCPHSAA